MTRSEFLKQLREALENDLSGSVVQENVDYYDNYIQEEVRNGKNEQEVIDMLGDPWALARTVADSVGISAGGYQEEKYTYRPDQEGTGRQTSSVFGFDTWWKKLLLILVLVGIVLLVVTIVTGLLSLVIPVLLPLIFIVFIIRLFSNRR